MLEVGSVLRTWRLDAPPSLHGTATAEPLGDHRLIYLDYEGPVSGNRGAVTRWDRGTYSDLSEFAGVIQFRLEGTRIRGICTLVSCERGKQELRLDPATE